MAVRFWKRSTGGGTTTYDVVVASDIVGQVRGGDVTKWAFKPKGINEFSGRYSSRRAAANAMLLVEGFNERVLPQSRSKPRRNRSIPVPQPTKPLPLPRSESLPQPEADGRTPITCACGHTYRYQIRRPSAITWLQGRPCPPCQRKADGGGTPPPATSTEKKIDLPVDKNVPEYKPEPEPEPVPAPARPIDEAWIDGHVERLPVGLFHEALPDVILLLGAGLPVWEQGPPGTSKSTIAHQAAMALGLSFHPVSCHELMTRSDLFGFTDANGIDHRTPLWDAYEYGGVVLLDEVDNGNPNLLAALNSALSNGHCVFGSGTVVERHANFRVVATANTAGLGPEAGFIGRNGVDLATRDRFVTVHVDIDDRLEAALAKLHSGEQDEQEREEFIAAAYERFALRDGLRGAADSEQVLKTVRRVRERVESRFRGSVVSPRATIHVAMMVSVGFSIDEALRAKLPGLTKEEATSIIPVDF
jgi:MoxR-like ATPase